MPLTSTVDEDATTVAIIEADLGTLQTDVTTIKTSTTETDIDVDEIISTLGTPTGVSISADIAALKAETAEIDAIVDLLPNGGALTSLAQDATVAKAATALSTVQWTNARAANLDNLDATVSSRLATTGYTAPDNTTVSNIYSRIGAPAGASISADIAEVEGETDAIIATLGTPAGASIAADIAAIKTETAEIDAIVDLLPNGGALTSLAQDATVAKASVLGTPAGASIAADLAEIEGETDSIGTLVSSTASTGTYTYTTGTTEQIITEIVTTTRITINGAFFDLVNMTKSGTVGVYCKIDGTNYRQLGTFPFNQATDSVGMFLNLHMGVTNSVKFTYQATTTEGSNRSIPFSVIYDTRQ